MVPEDAGTPIKRKAVYTMFTASDIRTMMLKVHADNFGLNPVSSRQVNKLVRAGFTEDIPSVYLAQARTVLISVGLLNRTAVQEVELTTAGLSTIRDSGTGLRDLTVSTNVRVPSQAQLRFLVVKAMPRSTSAQQPALHNNNAIVAAFPNADAAFKKRLRQYLSIARSECVRRGYINKVFSDAQEYTITPAGLSFIEPAKQQAISTEYKIDPNESNTTVIGLGGEDFVFETLEKLSAVLGQTIHMDDRMTQHSGSKPLYARQVVTGTHINGSKQTVDGMFSTTASLPKPTILQIKAAKNDSDYAWVSHIIMDSATAESDLPVVIIAEGPGYDQSVLNTYNARFARTAMFPRFVGAYTLKEFTNLIFRKGWKSLAP